MLSALDQPGLTADEEPEERIRNGPRAVQLAEQADAMTGGGNPVIIATLSAAYAETGRFQDAARTARRALDLASATDNKALADLIKAQIALYEAGMPTERPRTHQSEGNDLLLFDLSEPDPATVIERFASAAALATCGYIPFSN